MRAPVAIMAGDGSLEEAAAARMDFSQIVREHQAMVYSIAWHYLHDRGTAEEVAQDVFLQLHRDFHAMESPHHVVFWLRRVTCHRCIDHVRRRAKVAQVALEDLPEPGMRPAEPDPLLSDRLRKLVASLPEKQRMVVVLRFQEEMEIEEIARLLGMPARTVRSHLHRALGVLREKAARYLGEVEA